MQYRTLGSTGLSVSPICFGTSRFAREVDGTIQTTRDEAHALLDRCLDLGINFFDCANIYGTPSGTAERWLGEWLTGVDREEVVVASKVRWRMGDGPNRAGLSRKHVKAQLRASLERLGTDYVDLYYIHGWDDETPIRETLRAMDDLVREGLVHHLGASNTAAWQLVRALWESDVDGLERFSVTQPRFNAAYREAPAPLLDVCADQGLAVCPYAGLAGGFLTGKYDRDASPPPGSRADVYGWEDRFEARQWRVLDAVREVAAESGATPAQVALRWLLDREAFTCVPIVAARTREQLDENAGAVDVTLSDAQRERITDAYD